MSLPSTRFRLFRALALCAAALPALAACGGGKRACTDPDEPYLSARNQPPLRTPDGLAQPSRSEALAIPDGGSAPAVARSREAGCLDEPPSYFRSSGLLARSPEEVVASWAQAWSSREAEGVVELYSSSFEAPTDTAGSAAWLEQRREQVATGPVPEPVVEALAIVPDGPDRRVATFIQRFGSNALRKELTLVREAGSWRIVAEKVVEVR